MSCNGCRILRKGCNDNCILRQSLECIESPQAQANATLFVAKFFGRAGLVSFLSSVPQSQRPALFQSLLFEACGRTVNPVNGAVGLLWTGNWHVCQSAAETVLRGGVLRPLPEFEAGLMEPNDNSLYASFDLNKRLKASDDNRESCSGVELGLAAAAAVPPVRMTAGGRANRRNEKKRSATPPSDESETTTLESGYECYYNQELQLNRQGHETKLLQLFS